METYLVGGAVRDKLMGITPRDSDHVIIGATSEELKQLGYQEVGKSFNVFLHPETKEEYALPRGEDLVEDLSHRDLTINAMAMNEHGALVDPFHGSRDIEEKTLRHVSSHFADDLLRVYRIMRFKAQFPDFTIAPETQALLKDLVKTSEFKNVDPERVFLEMRKALGTPKPSLFFEGLKDMGALTPLFSELEALIDVPQNPVYHPEGDAWTHTMLVLDQGAKVTYELPVRYSCLVHDLGKGITPKKILPKHIGHEESGLKLVKDFGKRFRIPNEWLEASMVVTKFHLKVHRLKEMKASTIVRMFYEMDAFRKPHLVNILAQAAEADEMGKLKDKGEAESDLEAYFSIVRDVSSKDVVIQKQGKEVGEAIREERIRRLQAFIKDRL